MSDTEDDLAEEAFAHEQELLAREAALAAADAAQEAAEAEEAERQAKRARHGDAAGSSLPRGDAAGSSSLPRGGAAGSSSLPRGDDDDDVSPTQERAFAPEQQRAFDEALGGSNLFITGGPGTGKSFTVRRIIAALEEKNGSGSVLTWAPTGVAAILVGGQTMQSTPGPGVPGSSTGFEKVWGSKKYWREVRTLVLDEVSMADAEFIDWIEAHVRELVAREGKQYSPWAKADQPFGGLQLIFVGDFCQLPPVPVSEVSLASPQVLQSWERASRTQCGGWLERVKVPVGCKETKGKWAFQTCCWRDARFECIELQKCYRTGDPILLNALHELRRGHASHPAVQRLVQATQRPLPPRGDGIKPTVLYATKKAVEAENRDELRRLDPATERVYRVSGTSRGHVGRPAGGCRYFRFRRRREPHVHPSANIESTTAA